MLGRDRRRRRDLIIGITSSRLASVRILADSFDLTAGRVAQILKRLKEEFPGPGHYGIDPDAVASEIRARSKPGPARSTEAAARPTVRAGGARGN